MVLEDSGAAKNPNQIDNVSETENSFNRWRIHYKSLIHPLQDVTDKPGALSEI